MTDKKISRKTKVMQSAIVALIGRPNVGKSTLFNRITKSRKALVDPTPGVTRDRQYERVDWEHKTFILVDTGGIAAESGPAEERDIMSGNIREQTLQAVAEADVLLFLLDGREGVTPTDFDVTNLLRRTYKPVYYVVNKIDGEELEPNLLPSFYELGVERLWPVSAEHGYGVRSLMDDLITVLPEHQESSLQPAESIRIAFFGRPNVGKSSLINRLLGEDRMLVSDIPGTTRDAVDTLVDFDEQNVLLIDTAGIRRRGRLGVGIERYSVIRALRAVDRADVVLLVLDATELATAQDMHVAGYVQRAEKGIILIVNKWDVAVDRRTAEYDRYIRSQFRFLPYAPVLYVSAKLGRGIDQVLPQAQQVYRERLKRLPTTVVNDVVQQAAAECVPEAIEIEE